MHFTQSAFCPQRVSLHTFFQVCGQGFGHSMPYCEGESQAVEALDLPAPTCFRSRSHSYLRAIQAGCSQDDDTASVDSESPPPTSKGYSYNSNTCECQWPGWAEPLLVSEGEGNQRSCFRYNVSRHEVSYELVALKQTSHEDQKMYLLKTLQSIIILSTCCSHNIYILRRSKTCQKLWMKW